MPEGEYNDGGFRVSVVDQDSLLYDPTGATYGPPLA